MSLKFSLSFTPAVFEDVLKQYRSFFGFAPYWYIIYATVLRSLESRLSLVCGCAKNMPAFAVYLSDGDAC